VIGFTSQVGNSYNIQAAPGLSSGAWTALLSGIPGNGGTVQATISKAFVQPQQFFRIQMAP